MTIHDIGIDSSILHHQNFCNARSWNYPGDELLFNEMTQIKLVSNDFASSLAPLEQLINNNYLFKATSTLVAFFINC